MSYYDLPGAPPEEYATAGIGYIPYPQHVDPGIDVSHYGAPYQGMFGLGADDWTPGPGQRPADDPRMVKKFAEITVTYRPSNIPSAKAQAASDTLLAKARTAFSGMTVRHIGTTGWTNDGRVGFTIILPRDTRAGEIKGKVFQLGQDVGPRIGTGTALVDSRVVIPGRMFVTASAPQAEDAASEPLMVPMPTADEGSFLTKRVAGLPVWAVGIIGLGILGGGGYMLLRKKPVSANKRRRRRSRR